MQPVNDDMDELYRRAAEDYPLDTNSADWNAVLKKLKPDTGNADGSSFQNNNYKHLLWLLLLLPLGWLYKSYLSGDKKTDNTIAVKNTVIENTTKASLPENTSPMKKAVAINGLTPQLLLLKNSSLYRRRKNGKLNSFISNTNSISVMPDNSVPKNASPENDVLKKESEVVIEVKNNNKLEENKNGVTVKQEDKREDKPITENVVNTKSDQKKIPKNKEKGFYVGIIISPDFSTIKFQSIKKTGMSLGLVAGYQLNKKISVESGVYKSFKNYYSRGENFSTSKIQMPPGAKINSVDGECNMIEVPVVVKYNFSRSGKNIFSASAGVSSYFMKKEKYVYVINRNGQVYPYSATYKSTTSDLLAVANVALGYNRQIKNNLALRIEPYIKVPVTGVGIGQLPIMSTGLNIGIIKKISR